MKENPSLSLLLVPQILKSRVTAGRRFSIPIIDPASLSQEIVPIEVAGKERIIISGETKEAYRLKGSSKSTDFSVWVTETGEILKEERVRWVLRSSGRKKRRLEGRRKFRTGNSIGIRREDLDALSLRQGPESEKEKAAHYWRHRKSPVHQRQAPQGTL